MKYTSFAIAVIESIWPHPKGYDYYAESDPESGDELPILGTDATDIVGQTFHEDAEEASGWYKIIPLNITSFKTQSSTAEGNKWSVTFTADDMILMQIGVKDEASFQGTAILSDVMDAMLTGIDLGERTITANDLLTKSKLAGLPYASRRVSLKDNLFNIQDLAIPGDTMSIWFYNDPAEFFPFEAVQSTIKNSTNIEADLYEVIGSGDRRGQFKTNDDQYASEFKLGLPNFLYARAIESVKKGQPVSKNFNTGELDLMGLTTMQDSTRLVEMGGENIKGIVGAMESRVDNTGFSGGATRNPGGLFADQLAWYLTNQYPEQFSGYTSIYSGKGTVDKPTSGNTSTSAVWTKDSGIKYENKDVTNVQIQYYLLTLFKDAAHLQGKSDSEIAGLKGEVDKVLSAKASGITSPELEANPTRPQELEPKYGFNPDLYLAGRKAFASLIAAKANEAAKVMASSTIENKFLTSSIIKRKTLTNKGFGETAYLVMKGHVQGISTSRSSNNQTITVNGSGMEYPLEKHLVFFDTVTDLLASNGYLQDYRNSSLSAMNPAQQMLFLITKYAPKQIK